MVVHLTQHLGDAGVLLMLGVEDGSHVPDGHSTTIIPLK